MSSVAVVILNYNGSHFLRKFLPTLIKHSPSGTIYVADNCSTDDSLETLQSFPEVNTILLDENTGYAGGYNNALAQIEADYYALVNSDIEVTTNWLQPLIEYLDNHVEYAAVQPKVLDFNKKDYFEYAGASGGYIDRLGYPYCRGRIFDTLEKDDGQYDQITDVFWTTGACFMVRSSIFHQLGGFPADFFAHMEEIDLCWRLNSLQQKLACVPDSVVYHVGGGTLNKTSPRKTYLNFRNNFRLLIRNAPKNRLWLILPLRIVLDWLAGVLFWKNNSFAHFTAVLKAHKDAYRSIRKDLKIENRSLPNESGSLLVKYYLKGKKRYNQLNNTK